MAHQDVDLANLEWQATDGTVPEGLMLRLALRHGIACSAGIAVPPEGFLPLTYIVQLIDLRKIDSSKLPGRELMEALIPGWTEHTKQSDDAVNESLARTRREAGKDLERALAADVNPELVSHWRNLGGVVPPT
jgi:hypothetical protein